jgi:hypothetical protein
VRCATETACDSAAKRRTLACDVAPELGFTADEVVYTLVQPGQEFDYSVQTPANEPAGLYWYHPHPYGFSEGQVQEGATGATDMPKSA